MTREEEYQRRYLLDELNAMTGYGNRRLVFNSRLTKPDNVRRAENVVERWNTRLRNHERKFNKMREDAFSNVRKAIAFRDYKGALAQIEALKRRARGK
jgi:hypothetical protein